MPSAWQRPSCITINMKRPRRVPAYRTTDSRNSVGSGKRDVCGGLFIDTYLRLTALFPLILFRLFQPLPAEFTAAVQLVIEVILFEELVAAVLQSAFPPVLFPKDCTGIKGGCPFSRFVYLVEAFQREDARVVVKTEKPCSEA